MNSLHPSISPYFPTFIPSLKQRPLKFLISILSVVFILFLACSPNPYAKTNKAHKHQVKELAKRLRTFPPANSLDNSLLQSTNSWVGTTNFGLRKPNFVIIHHTAQDSCGQTLRTFTLPRTQVSAHYVICKDGTIHHMLNDYLRAHHAGIGSWGYDRDLNSSSIGIELDNNGFENFPEAQLISLYRVLDTLKKRHNIPTENIIGHGDIAPTRKNDPNWRFPWKALSEKGFGRWHGDTTGITIPENFDHIMALRLVGFDTKDSTASILAFKRHWMQDTTLGMTPEAKRILYTLIQ